jgi:hypothetical protein
LSMVEGTLSTLCRKLSCVSTVAGDASLAAALAAAVGDLWPLPALCRIAVPRGVGAEARGDEAQRVVHTGGGVPSDLHQLITLLFE